MIPSHENVEIADNFDSSDTEIFIEQEILNLYYRCDDSCGSSPSCEHVNILNSPPDDIHWIHLQIEHVFHEWSRDSPNKLYPYIEKSRLQSILLELCILLCEFDMNYNQAQTPGEDVLLEAAELLDDSLFANRIFKYLCLTRNPLDCVRYLKNKHGFSMYLLDRWESLNVPDDHALLCAIAEELCNSRTHKLFDRWMVAAGKSYDNQAFWLLRIAYRCRYIDGVNYIKRNVKCQTWRFFLEENRCELIKFFKVHGCKCAGALNTKLLAPKFVADMNQSCQKCNQSPTNL